MSNPQHPQFANATAVNAPHAALERSVESDFSRPAQRGMGGRHWSIGLGIAGLGLWAFLVTELASKFSPPAVF